MIILIPLPFMGMMQPNAGIMKQPNAGIMKQPNAGMMLPNAGMMQPNAGIMKQPNAGMMQPKAGILILMLLNVIIKKNWLTDVMEI
jgi:hypothetical protein